VNVLVVGTGGSIVSGVSTAADEMVKTLRDLGHDAERVVAGGRMRRRSNTVNIENVRAVLDDARTVRRRARDTDADLVWIHAMGVPLLPALRALALALGARLARRPAVVRFHAFGLERSVDAGGLPLRLALRALAAVSVALVAEHEAAADALAGVVGTRKVHVLHNWVDVPDVVTPMPARPPLRAVFVGGIVRRKGAPQLLDAMRLLGDVDIHLTMVGGPAEDGADAYDRLRRRAQDLVDAGRVTFAGEQDPAGVRAALRAAHLFVLPSDAEGMPLAMVEALAEGRPVLVTDAGNMAAVVREAGCGWLLPDREPATIAEALGKLVDDPAVVTSAATAAHATAAARFSPSAVASHVHEVLALAGRAPRR
jgi:glycosyltransferase involved in cell wall biosynthesis